MQAGRYNIRLYQGDTWSISPVWKITSSITGSLVPVDVTGYTADMQVRRTTGSSTVIVELSTGNGRIVTGSTDGKFTLSLSAVQTAALDVGNYVYDLEVTAPDSTVTKLLHGAFAVRAEVTR